MPIHVDELVSEVTVFDGELPFSDDQISKLVAIVAQRISAQQQGDRSGGEIFRRCIMPTLDMRG